MNSVTALDEAQQLDHSQRLRRKRKRVLLMVVIPTLVLAAVGLFYLAGGRYVSTDNAYVKADKVPVSAQVSGLVKTVLVEENEAVTAGQALFQLDPEPFQLAVEKAAAQLAQVRSDMSALKASYREKQAEIRVAQTKFDFSRTQQKRQVELKSQNYVSASQLDDAEQNTRVAELQLKALNEDLQRIRQALDGDVDTPVEQLPAYQAAKAALDQAKYDLQNSEVRAAQDGVVSQLPKPGQYLNAGSPALTLVASKRLWIEANFNETDLTYVRPGQAVTVHVDTYPGVVWHGEVESISPATGSEFSVLPAQNVTGNWVKVVQRLAVRIRLNDSADLPPLRMGLSALAEIDTGHRRSLFGLSF